MTVQAEIAGVWSYVLAHGVELVMLALVLVVLPLVTIYAQLRALVIVGDWLDGKAQQWRAERFRQHRG